MYNIAFKRPRHLYEFIFKIKKYGILQLIKMVITFDASFLVESTTEADEKYIIEGCLASAEAPPLQAL